MYNKLTPDLLSLLVSPAMQLSDAGCVSVFRELIPLLRAMCAMYGDSEVRLVVEWLGGKAGWSEEQSREWIELLSEGDSKKLSEALKRIKAEQGSGECGDGVVRDERVVVEWRMAASYQWQSYAASTHKQERTV